MLYNSFFQIYLCMDISSGERRGQTITKFPSGVEFKTNKKTYEFFSPFITSSYSFYFGGNVHRDVIYESKYGFFFPVCCNMMRNYQIIHTTVIIQRFFLFSLTYPLSADIPFSGERRGQTITKFPSGVEFKRLKYR